MMCCLNGGEGGSNVISVLVRTSVFLVESILFLAFSLVFCCIMRSLQTLLLRLDNTYILSDTRRVNSVQYFEGAGNCLSGSGIRQLTINIVSGD